MSDTPYDHTRTIALAEEVMETAGRIVAAHDKFTANNALAFATTAWLTAILQLKPDYARRINERLLEGGAEWKLVPRRNTRH
jgi:hypothetical protein